MMEIVSGVLTNASIWLIWLIIAGITAYWYLTNRHDYWKQVGIPYVPAVPVLGSMTTLFTQPRHEIDIKRNREIGRIYGAYEGRKPVLSVADPDVLRDIFVKDFQFFTRHRTVDTGNPLSDKMLQNLHGEDWKRIRSIVTPAFTTGRMKRMTNIFADSAKTLTSNFKTAAKEGKAVNMKRLFGAFTMDVIASSAFGTKIDSHNDPENPFLNSARAVFSSGLTWRAVLFFLFPGLIKLFKIDLFSPRALDFFEAVVLKIMEERKKTGKKRNDFLQLLIDAAKGDMEKEVETVPDEKDSAKEIGHEEANDQIFKSYITAKSMSNDELIAQCIIFFLAGYETTASTLSFTAYELALNPDIQDRLIAEIDQIVEQKGELNYEAVSEMTYLNKVVSETLRKHPPATRTERVADQDYYIKDHNVTVPKGMIVGIPIHAIHHDAEHYPEPEKYDPDRFNPEQKSARHPYTYLPFGAGPRNCVAMRFALLEVKVCLAYVLSRCRFSTCSQTKVPLEYVLNPSLLQPKEVMLKVEIREDAKKL